MAYLSFYRKYRPQTFAEVLGQEHVTQTLANAVSEGRIAHAYLFTGPRGTGKTSTARILAKALNCDKGPTPTPCGTCESCVAIANGSSLDVFEMDAASHSGVDDTREILAGVPLATAGGRRKVYVIDEVHMLTSQSFNALLKTLEEPPEHVIFVLATTEAHKVLPTIVSRTQRFDFRRVTAEILEQHLSNVAKLENLDVEQEALGVLARHSEGSVRDALSSLDQLVSFGDAVTLADAEALLGRRAEDALYETFDAISAGDVGGVFRSIQVFVAQGADLRQLAFDALEHARTLLLLKAAPEAESLVDASGEDRARLLSQAETFSGQSLLRVLDLIGKAIIEMRNAPNHRLLLEVALVRSAAPDTDPSATGLLGRIERLERRAGIAESASLGPAGGGDAVLASDSPRSRSASRPTEGRLADASLRNSPAAAPPPAPTKEAESAPPGGKPKGKRAKETTPVVEAPATTTPAESPPSTPPAGDGIGLGHFRDAWSAVLTETNKVSKRVAAYLHSSRPLAWDNGVLTVESQSGFHATAMSEQANRDVLAEAVHAALGVKPKLQFAERGGAVEAAATTSDLDDTTEDYAATEPLEGGAHDPLEVLKRGLNAEVIEERSADS